MPRERKLEVNFYNSYLLPAQKGVINPDGSGLEPAPDLMGPKNESPSPKSLRSVHLRYYAYSSILLGLVIFAALLVLSTRLNQLLLVLLTVLAWQWLRAITAYKFLQDRALPSI